MFDWHGHGPVNPERIAYVGWNSVPWRAQTGSAERAADSIVEMEIGEWILSDADEERIRSLLPMMVRRPGGNVKVT